MKRILKYVSKYKWLLILGSISMLVLIGVDLFMPYLQKVFIDNGIIEGNSKVIINVLIGISIITITKAILGYGKEILYDILSVKVHEDIRNDLFNHIQKLEFKYFDDMNTGELMSRIGEENSFSDCDAGDKGNKWTEKITCLDSLVTRPFQCWELIGGAV